MGDYSAKRVCTIVKTDDEEFEFFLKFDEKRNGQVITSVTVNGPADKAGLKNEDRVLEVNGADVANSDHEDVVSLIRECIPKNKVTFTVIDRKNDPNTPRPKDPIPRLCKIKKKTTLGFSLEVNDEKQGHFIREVVKGGPAMKSGVKLGDRLVCVNDVDVDSLSHSAVVEMIKKSGNKVKLLVIEPDGYDALASKGVKVSIDLIKYRKKSTKSSSSSSIKSSSKSSVTKQAIPETKKSAIEIFTPEEVENKVRIIHLFKPDGKGYGFFLRVKKGDFKERIGKLEPGGIAQCCGLKEDDLLVAVNGTLVGGTEHDKIISLIKRKSTQVILAVVDNKTNRYFEARGGKRGQSDLHLVHSFSSRNCTLKRGEDGYGFYLKMEQDTPFHVVTNVDENGVAAKAGIKNDEVILSVSGENTIPMSHAECVQKIKDAGDQVKLSISERKSAEFFYKVGVVITDKTHEEWPSPEEFTLPTFELPKPTPPASVTNEDEEIDKLVVEETEESHTSLKEYHPRLCRIKKKNTGFGFFLRDENGHFLGNVEKEGPAAEAGILENDRIIEVNGYNIERETHEEVVARIRNSGSEVTFLVVDPECDEYFKKNSIIPTVALVKSEDTYTEVVKVKHYPKLCKLHKQATGYGFHLNGETGREGQFLKKIVPGGAADIAGVAEGDRIIEINGENVERESHDMMVQKIKRSGDEVTFLLVDIAADTYFRSKKIAITAALITSTKEDENAFDSVSKTSSTVETEADVHQADTQDELVNAVDKITEVVEEHKSDNESDATKEEAAIDALNLPGPPEVEIEEVEDDTREAIAAVVAVETVKEIMEEVKEEQKEERAFVDTVEDVIEDVKEDEIVGEMIEAIQDEVEEKDVKEDEIVDEMIEAIQDEVEEKESTHQIGVEVVYKADSDTVKEIKEEVIEQIEEVEKLVDENVIEELTSEDIEEEVSVVVQEVVAERNDKEAAIEAAKMQVIGELGAKIQEEKVKDEIIEVVEEKAEDVIEELVDTIQDEIEENKREEIIESVKEEIIEEIVDNVEPSSIVEEIKDEVEEDNEIKPFESDISIVEEVKIELADENNNETIIRAVDIINAADVIKEKRVEPKPAPVVVETSNKQQGGPIFINSNQSVRSYNSNTVNGNKSNGVIVNAAQNSSTVEQSSSSEPSVETAKKSLVQSIRESIEKRNQEALQNGNAFSYKRQPSVGSTVTTINPKKKTMTKQIWAGDNMNINIVETTQY